MFIPCLHLVLPPTNHIFAITLLTNQLPSKLTMAKPKLTLYVDIVSPFAYMAYYTTRHSPMFKDVEITYKPIFLGGLMKACDNRTPVSQFNFSEHA
jgi:2-hydroxychromene-2-carboxylate isomerase